MIEVKNLRKSFGSLKVLNGVNLSVGMGQVGFVIGPSGGGKSTLLRCLNFLEKPDGGTIIFGNVCLCHEGDSGMTFLPEHQLRLQRAHMPMVFQHFNLFSHMTVLQNVTAAPQIVLRQTRAEAIQRATAALKSVGLSDKLESYPAQLSGGQKQRVGIARALAMNPKLILFDEPTSSLDPELVSEVLEIIRKLASDGMTMLIVSHEMAFAKKLADVVFFIAEGEVREFGSPEQVFDRPKTARLKVFLDSIIR
jgi:ABC-type polar amino acid transport system ATPase subunit